MLPEQDWRAGGQFLQLSDGLTHWRREGSPDGVPLVLVHGATVPSWEFDFLVPPLLRAGFQVLRFDLYGHGASERPHGAYTFDRFKRQLTELIDASDFPRPAIFLGHSFGAALVAAVAAERPECIQRLVLVAPMLDFSSTTAWTSLFRYPGIGEIAMHGIAIPALIRRRRRRYQHIGQPHLTPRFIEQVEYAGFARGLLSMFRTGALGDQAARYAALRQLQRNVLVITGEHDTIIPAEHVARVRALLPDHQHLSIQAEHNLLLTHPEVVVDTLMRWSRIPLSPA
jgi:pimeloyl-ACP methyl ester carboxylesterase